MQRVRTPSWFTSYGALSPDLKRMLLAGLVNNFGIGLTVPIGLLFVSQVLGSSVDRATLTVALTSVGALISHPLTGYFADKRSKFGAALLGVAFSIVGSLVYAVATDYRTALGAAFITGLGLGTSTAWFAILSSASQEQERAFVFGVNQVSVNVGMGAGVAVAGLATAFASEGVFRALFLSKGLGFAILGVVLVHAQRTASTMAPSSECTKPQTPESSAAAGGGSSRVALAGLALTVLVLYTFGYSQLDAGLIAAIVESGTMPAWTISFALLINTVAVVGLNVVTVPRLEGRRPFVLALSVPAIWAASWLLSAGALEVLSPLFAVALVSAGVTLFAFGEVIYAVALPTMTAELVGAEYVGRAFGMQNLMASVGFILGPMLAAYSLGRASGSLTMIVCATGVMLAIVPIALMARPKVWSAPDPELAYTEAK